MKNVLIISQSLTSGGAERVAANLASDLKKHYNTKLLVLNGREKTYSTTAEIIDLNLEKPKNIFNKLFWLIKAVRMVRKIKKENKITDSISFLSQPDLINVLSKNEDKIIVSVRNKRSSLNRNLFNKIKDKFIFDKADKIVALSKGVKNDLISFYKTSEEKIKVIYNSCNLEEIKKQYQKNEKEIFDNNTRTIITAGRLTYQKGQWHLIRAFSKVANEFKDVQLVILGQGEEHEYLKKLSKNMKIDNNIIFGGYCDNPYYYLKKSDIFVFSSIYEGFGNILLEAMACDLPIVSTDCQAGPRELLAPNTEYKRITKAEYANYGILVPVCDGKKYNETTPLTKEENILADAIINILKKEEVLIKYKKASQKRIKDFSISSITEQWKEIIEK